MSEQAIRVAIVEDFKLIRMGILAAIEHHEVLDIVGEFDRAEDFLDYLDGNGADVVLLDLGLPGISGIDAIARIKEKSPSTKIVVLTARDSRDEVVASIAKGANAYCLKDIPAERFAEVIKSVHEGAAWLDPMVAQYALDLIMDQAKAGTLGLDEPPAADLGPAKAQGDARNRDLRFTPKERLILPKLVEGKSNQEIAQELGISVHTVKVHISNILEKLSVYDRVQAAVKVVREGLI